MNPFSPSPTTVNIDVASSSARVKLGDMRGVQQIRVMNNGSATAWIQFGGSTVAAALATSIPIGPGGTEVLTAVAPLDSDLYVAAIAAASTGKIYFTPGEGI